MQFQQVFDMVNYAIKDNLLKKKEQSAKTFLSSSVSELHVHILFF